MQITDSGTVENIEQMEALTKSRKWAAIVICHTVENLEIWKALVLDGEQVLYVGTEEKFTEWLKDEHGVQ